MTPVHPVRTIVLPPRCCVRDLAYPVEVQYIQPVEVINRYHPVPVPRYSVTYRERNEVLPFPPQQPYPYPVE